MNPERDYDLLTESRKWLDLKFEETGNETQMARRMGQWRQLDAEEKAGRPIDRLRLSEITAPWPRIGTEETT